MSNYIVGVKDGAVITVPLIALVVTMDVLVVVTAAAVAAAVVAVVLVVAIHFKKLKMKKCT